MMNNSEKTSSAWRNGSSSFQAKSVTRPQLSSSKTATKSTNPTHNRPAGSGARKPMKHVKSSVPTAVKAIPFAEARRSGGGEREGQSAPRLSTAMLASRRPQRAARKTNPADHPHGEPAGGRFYVKNGVARRIETDEDSDSSMEDVDDLHQSVARPMKAARKVDLSSVGSNLARKSGRSALKAARKTETIYISSDSEETLPSDSDDAHSDLIAAFDALTIPTRLRIHNCLPFLLRNLRVGFLARCESIGIRTLPKDVPDRSVRILYRYRPDADDDEWEERLGESDQWVCPICDLHETMNTREMVAYHLKQDHDEVEATWEELSDRWQVTVTLKSVQEDALDVQPEISGLNQDTPAIAPDTAPLPESDTHMSFSSVVQPTVPSNYVPHKHEIEEELDLAALRALREIPPIDPLCSGITEDGTLIPPPKESPYGPAARYPYLRGEMISCRVGGPRLYDLLNELSLDEFGILSWSIVDREEEIFELEDVRDEDKVMLVLWNRWIMLNRVKFVFCGYLQGVKEFIDKYYQMIHRAAGWHALRMFLLMLKANRLLSLADIGHVLKYYEEKVGMNDWYKETDVPDVNPPVNPTVA